MLIKSCSGYARKSFGLNNPILIPTPRERTIHLIYDFFAWTRVPAKCQTLRAQFKSFWNKKCHGGIQTKELGQIFGPWYKLRDILTVRCKHWIKTNRIKTLQFCSFKLKYGYPFFDKFFWKLIQGPVLTLHRN